MSCNDVMIIQSSDEIKIKQESQSIQVQPLIEVIEVCAQNPVAQFLPYFFIATQGQTVFTLPAIALSVPLCAINGTAQAQVKTPVPDFIITENILTLSSGVDDGDTVFGVIQVS